MKTGLDTNPENTKCIKRKHEFMRECLGWIC